MVNVHLPGPNSFLSVDLPLIGKLQVWCIYVEICCINKHI